MDKKITRSFPKRGEVHMVNFEPTIGSEIRKTRPAVILQNDIANRHSPVTIVAAITSQFDEPAYPTEVIIGAMSGFNDKPSAVLLNQIRTIDKQRLIKKIGTLTKDVMQKVDRALAISIGLTDTDI